MPDCVICLAPLSGGELLPCSHAFHASCITSWFRRGKPECPVCRHVPEDCQPPQLTEDRSTLAIVTERGLVNLLSPLLELSARGCLEDRQHRQVNAFKRAWHQLRKARRRAYYYERPPPSTSNKICRARRQHALASASAAEDTFGRIGSELLQYISDGSVRLQEDVSTPSGESRRGYGAGVTEEQEDDDDSENSDGEDGEDEDTSSCAAAAE